MTLRAKNERRGTSIGRPVAGRVSVAIESMAEDGAAVGRQVGGEEAGRVVFVDGAAPGEWVDAIVDKCFSRHARATLERVTVPSTLRVEPPCEVADRCGGCPWQHVDLDEQRRQKLLSVERALAKLWRATSSDGCLPKLTIATGGDLGWRAHARLHWFAGPSGQRVGYRARRSHDVVEPESCLVLHPSVRPSISAIKTALAKWGGRGSGTVVVSAAQPAGGAGGNSGAAWVASVWIAERSASSDIQWVEALAQAMIEAPECVGVVVKSASGAASSVGCESTALHWFSQSGGPSVQIDYPVGGFRQAHAELATELIGAVVGAVGPHAGVRVADLYAGAGTFSLPLAAAGAEVWSLESASLSVQALQSAASAAQLNVSASEVDLEAPDSLRVLPENLDAVVLDPPREGALPVCRQLAASQVPRVVYVSCHLATWLRDAEVLCRGGYQLDRLAVFDMFPHTPHLELLSEWQLARG